MPKYRVVSGKTLEEIMGTINKRFDVTSLGGLTKYGNSYYQTFLGDPKEVTEVPEVTEETPKITKEPIAKTKKAPVVPPKKKVPAEAPKKVNGVVEGFIPPDMR